MLNRCLVWRTARPRLILIYFASIIGQTDYFLMSHHNRAWSMCFFSTEHSRMNSFWTSTFWRPRFASKEHFRSCSISSEHLQIRCKTFSRQNCLKLSSDSLTRNNFCVGMNRAPHWPFISCIFEERAFQETDVSRRIIRGWRVLILILSVLVLSFFSFMLDSHHRTGHIRRWWSPGDSWL